MNRKANRRTIEKRTAEYRISNIESRRNVFCHLILKNSAADTVMINSHRGFFLPFFAVLMLVTNIEISSLFS